MNLLRSLFLLALLMPGLAWGQARVSPAPFTGSYPFFNATGLNGYELYGTPTMGMSNAANAPAFWVGPYAGASLPAGAQIDALAGLGSFESMTGATAENTGLGAGAGINVTTGGGHVAVGTSTCAGITTQGSDVCVGSDAMRNYGGAGTDIGIGAGSLADGNGGFPNFAIGANALWGAASTITIGGSITTGDVLSFPLSSSNSCNGSSIVINCTTGLPTTVSYTVTSGDTTLAILAGHIASALSASGAGYTLGDGTNETNRNLFALQFQIADPTNHPTVLKGHYPWSWKIIVGAMTCVGTCGETATIGGGFTGGADLLVGNFLFANPLLTTASNNTVVVITGGPSAFVTTASSNAFFGDGIAPNLNSASNNSCFGHNTCASLSINGENAVFGAWAGNQITGQKNSVFGDQASAGSGCITSGNNNTEVGQGACVPSPTTNNQLSIANAIWGANNSGTGASASTGAIGIEIVPTASSYTSTWLGGEVVVGSGSALATGATAGFVHLPFTTAAPNGIPANILGNSCEVNTTSQSLNCYIGASWYHVTLTSGAA